MADKPYTPDDVQNDLRKLANYCRPLEKIARRLADAKVVERLDERDLDFLKGFAGPCGIVLSNLELDVDNEYRSRWEEEDRRKRHLSENS